MIVMPQSISALRRDAAAAATERGHHLWWSLHVSRGRTIYVGICSRCEMTVSVTTHPAPNEAEVAGDAVALNCDGKRRHP